MKHKQVASPNCWLCGGILLLALCRSATSTANQCDDFDTQGDTDAGGRVIVLNQELCSEDGYSDLRSVVVLLPSGRRLVVFKYEPAFSFAGYHDKAIPSVKWLSPGVLSIAIGAVAFIHLQKQKVGEIQIKYAIGEVIIKR